MFGWFAGVDPTTVEKQTADQFLVRDEFHSPALLPR